MDQYDIPLIESKIGLLLQNNPAKLSVLEKEAQPIRELINKNDESLGSTIYGLYHNLIEKASSLRKIPGDTPESVSLRY